MNKKNKNYGKVLKDCAKILLNTLFLSTMLFVFTNGQVYAVDSTPKFEVAKGHIPAVDSTSDSFSSPTQKKTVWILGDPKDSVEYSDGNVRGRIQYIRYGGNHELLKDKIYRVRYDNASKIETDLFYNQYHANKLEKALIQSISENKTNFILNKKLISADHSMWFKRVLSSLNIQNLKEIGTIEVYQKDCEEYILKNTPLGSDVRLRDSGGKVSQIEYMTKPPYESTIVFTHTNDCWKTKDHFFKLFEENNLLSNAFDKMKKYPKDKVVYFDSENDCKIEINIKKPLQLPASYNAQQSSESKKKQKQKK